MKAVPRFFLQKPADERSTEMLPIQLCITPEIIHRHKPATDQLLCSVSAQSLRSRIHVHGPVEKKEQLHNQKNISRTHTCFTEYQSPLRHVVHDSYPRTATHRQASGHRDRTALTYICVYRRYPVHSKYKRRLTKLHAQTIHRAQVFLSSVQNF